MEMDGNGMKWGLEMGSGNGVWKWGIYPRKWQFNCDNQENDD
jgi:hypothetical protein